MTSAVPAATFRDPAGSLSFAGDLAVRTVYPAARAQALEFLESPFCLRMQQQGHLIASSIVDDSGGTLRLHHPRIPTPSYPWEWTPPQWLAAAELTLDLCQQALADGWILKDATPLNILFTGPRPVFVDILSFERRNPRSSLWLAYGQYIRTFLLPLLMGRMAHWPLSLTLSKRDGYEPVECYDALGWRQRLSRAAFWPITLPTLLDRRKPAASPQKNRPQRIANPEVTASVLKRSLNSLRRQTRRAVPRNSASQWSSYPDTLTHYTAQQSQLKLDWVRATLEQLRPTRVLDVGANTGEFSALAAGLGAQVVALERDPSAAASLYQLSRQRDLPILTLQADIARPTPAVGWENSESLALLPRLEGQFDLVLLLAVIHHLLLMEQIPLCAILALCHHLTRRHLILEWVPVSDPMFQSLMRGRDSLYGSLAESDLLSACADRFHVRQRHALENGRILFHLERMEEKMDAENVDTEKIAEC